MFSYSITSYDTNIFMTSNFLIIQNGSPKNRYFETIILTQLRLYGLCVHMTLDVLSVMKYICNKGKSFMRMEA